MRVLWFTVTPSNFDVNNTSHNGGGWISSLETAFDKQTDIDLGIAFEHSDTNFRIDKNGKTYYPISVSRDKKYQLRKKLYFDTEEKFIIPECIKIIEDFKPDIIQIFGSEWCFGLVTQHTQIPVIIHMQGSIPPYYNARYAPGYNQSTVLRFSRSFKDVLKSLMFNDQKSLKRVEREERILKLNKFYFGRTKWDKAITQLYSPNSNYFYCSEALRDFFYKNAGAWKIQQSKKLIISTVGGGNMLKGVDTILRTAKLLRNNSNIEFEWRMYGPTNNISFFERKEGIKCQDVGVKLMGVASAPQLCDNLLESEIYIHPSYIDNSPNALCEAQLLGLPCIATDVGGVSSLIENMKTGILVPSNEPHMLAYQIMMLHKNKVLQIELSKNSVNKALERHSVNTIMNTITTTYKKLKAV